MKSLVTPERLRQVLRYDPETGLFVWLIHLSNKGPVGAVAGKVHIRKSHIDIGIDRRSYKAHRLAWLYMIGEWPIGDIDHRNTNPLDNRWKNLRDVSHATNIENRRRANINNISGLLGVRVAGNRFCAFIHHRGKGHYLGRYDTAQEAHEVYLVAKRKLHEGNTL